MSGRPVSWGLTPVAGLLHRNQTLCPTRPAPSGLCTGGPRPSGPGSIFFSGGVCGGSRQTSCKPRLIGIGAAVAR